MTWFHYINCMALTYVPFAIVYNTSKLSDYSALQSCMIAGLWFGATSAVKMMVMASWFPAEAPTGLSLSTEFGHIVVALIELAGIMMALKKTPMLGQYPAKLRVLVVALGWSFMESMLSYFIPLWIGARGEEFNWSFIEMGLLSNIMFLLHVGITGSVWLFSRRGLNKGAQWFAIVTCGAYVLLPTIVRLLTEVMDVDEFHTLIVRAVFAAIVALGTRIHLNTYENSR